MKLFKDLITGDEMFSDTFKIDNLHDGAVYRLKGTLVKENTTIDESAFGFNKSAEGADEGEGVEDTAVSVIDIVSNCKLVEMPAFASKKDYKTYLKDYFKSVKDKLESDDDKKKFQTGAMAFVTEVLTEFKEYQFFVGESMNPDGMHALCKWDGETPYFYFFKHGLEEEKV